MCLVLSGTEHPNNAAACPQPNDQSQAVQLPTDVTMWQFANYVGEILPLLLDLRRKYGVFVSAFTCFEVKILNGVCVFENKHDSGLILRRFTENRGESLAL